MMNTLEKLKKDSDMDVARQARLALGSIHSKEVSNSSYTLKSMHSSLISVVIRV